MRIVLVTPARTGSRSGNRVTALRWTRILRSLGHRVSLQRVWDGVPAGVLIALHAWRSAASVIRYRSRFPTRPLIVALTGTDIYHFQETHRDTVLRSLHSATALIALHDLAGEALPANFHPKIHVVRQSAARRGGLRRPSRRTFDVCVVGHLRKEKDPLRAARAARAVPPTSRLRVLHAGAARDPDWAAAARREMAINPRYRWLGEAPRWRVRRLYDHSHAMVLSSVMEGGANVLSEALVAGLPVIASRIPGNVGLLGPDYPGYYPPEDTDALRSRLLEAESDSGLLEALAGHGARSAPLFAPEREREAWRRLLEELS